MLDVVSAGPQSVIAVGGRLVVSMTLRPPTVESVGRFRELVIDRATEAGAGICSIIVPAAKRPALDAAVRAEIGKTFAVLMPNLTGTAIWIRRRSFVGALQRSLVTAMVLSIRGRAPTTVVSTAEAAATWFAQQDASLAEEVYDWIDPIERFITAFDPRPA